jgi:hypothetical protein
VWELRGRSESRSSSWEEEPSGDFEQGRGFAALKRDQAERNVLRPFDPVSTGKVQGGNLEATVL